MTIEGDYEPSALEWVRDQVAEYEASGGQRANTLRETGVPIVVITMRGHSSGKVRKIGLMRVEHGGEYALIGSYGGRAENPVWVNNLLADPRVTIQDGPEAHSYRVREVFDEERDEWFRRGVAVFPNYADYQARTQRVIPVFVATRAD
ncbi:MAG TPA: nitroreductase family deazaflavin-dependent oxidoreductase [Ilumatobacter sp.]|jgi:deazaflavin-dependent oxidoreductase (nitroreductase family)|nr:nitroreductase family deazaflavin-dependent oxidoreductase [Ilumatobacter sp.]